VAISGGPSLNGPVSGAIRWRGRRRHDPATAVERRRVADRDVQVVHQWRQRGGDRSGGHGISAQPQAEGQAGCGGAHGFEHLGEEARRLAVAVLAKVPFRGEELRAEIAMRRGHLNPVKSSLHRQRRAPPVRGDEFLNLAG
jgi:hypothetical protein